MNLPLDGSVTVRYSTVRYSASQCSAAGWTPVDSTRHTPPDLPSTHTSRASTSSSTILGPPFGRLRLFFHFNQSPIPETRNSTPSLSCCTLPTIWWLSCCILSYRCASRHLSVESVLSCPELSSPPRLDLILSSFLSFYFMIFHCIALLSSEIKTPMTSVSSRFVRFTD